MDFSNRNTQPQTVAPGAHPAASSAGSRKNNNNKSWMRFGGIALGVAIVVLLVALIFAIGFSNNQDSSESKYIDTSKLQAVFLNTGQVYFGNIKTLNNRYFVLTNIYYLQTSNNGTSSSSSNSNTSVSLVKLGCELHQPYDQMVINRSQVTFWENLQSTGQVAKAVQTFEKENPNGQKCADQSSSASTNSVNNTQNAGSSNGNTANTSTPATKP